MPAEDQPIDWRSVLVRYVTAVMNDDVTVGSRCLCPDTEYAPEWTFAESEALRSVHEAAWPKAMGPWSADYFDGCC